MPYVYLPDELAEIARKESGNSTRLSSWVSEHIFTPWLIEYHTKKESKTIAETIEEPSSGALEEEWKRLGLGNQPADVPFMNSKRWFIRQFDGPGDALAGLIERLGDFVPNNPRGWFIDLCKKMYDAQSEEVV